MNSKKIYPLKEVKAYMTLLGANKFMRIEVDNNRLMVYANFFDIEINYTSTAGDKDRCYQQTVKWIQDMNTRYNEAPIGEYSPLNKAHPPITKEEEI